MAKPVPPVFTRETLRRYFRYESDGSFTRLKTSGNGVVGVRTFGTAHHTGYRRLRFLGAQCAFHRLVWTWHYGPTSKAIDHINGKKDDNRIENLRTATPSENAFNSRLFKNNTSGARGVHWIKEEKSWAASIQIDGKRVKLGQSKERAIAEALYLGAARALRAGFLRDA